jgi:hypothetical protein
VSAETQKRSNAATQQRSNAATQQRSNAATRNNKEEDECGAAKEEDRSRRLRHNVW